MIEDTRGQRLRQLLRGRKIASWALEDFTEEEAVEIYRLTHNCGEIQARFVVAMERGTLPDGEFDENGDWIAIVY